MQSFDDGLERYRREWFRIDQLYRQFVYAARTAEYPKPLEALREQVEKRYTNKFVYELGNAWQQQVDQVEQVALVRRFARRRPSTPATSSRWCATATRRPSSSSPTRSGTRWPTSSARASGRRTASTPRLTPSSACCRATRSSAWRRCSRTRRSSTPPTPRPCSRTASRRTTPPYRGKILEGVGGTAIQAEDFKALNADERRELYKANRVLYVYHNRIDATGDKPGTERQVFEAVEDTLRDIVDLVKKLANANATNIFITADHGFLFQDEALADTFFLSTQPQGDDIKVTNRRFVLGHGLKADNAFATFGSAQLGLQSDLEVQIPKSIHRLRLAGGGSRFVHGGATLQEIVVPVLAVNKKRRSDTRLVNVEVWPESDKITTGQVVVRLFQSEPVQRQGAAPHAAGRAVRRRDAHLEPRRT